MLPKLIIVKAHSKTYPIPLQNKKANKHPTSWFNTTENLIHTISDTDEYILRCKKVNITFTPKQKEIIDPWFDIYKSTYNQTVKHIRKGGKNLKTGFYNLRTEVKSEFTEDFKKRMTKCHIPVHTVDNAIKDVSKAWKSAFGLAKITKRRFRIRYKRDTSTDTIVLESQSFSKEKNSFSKYVGEVVSSEPINGLKHDCRLQKNKNGYILFVPENIPTKINPNKKNIISLDPGLRAYQTGYVLNKDKTVECVEYGSNFIDEIKPIFKRIKPDTPRIRKYNQRLYNKIRHKIDDLQWKLAKELASGYNTVVIGNLSTKKVLSKDQLYGETKNLLNLASHYRFRQRLKSKCEEYGTKFVEQDESYTSKTCGSCGEINYTLGKSKLFTCPCGFRIDRDINGARNILIKSKIK